MSAHGDKRRFSAERDELLDHLQETLRAVFEIAQSLDPSGYNAAYVKDLLTEARGVVDKLQITDHALSWTYWKLDLIDRCMLSDRPQ